MGAPGAGLRCRASSGPPCPRHGVRTSMVRWGGNVRQEPCRRRSGRPLAPRVSSATANSAPLCGGSGWHTWQLSGQPSQLVGRLVCGKTQKDANAAIILMERRRLFTDGFKLSDGCNTSCYAFSLPTFAFSVKFQPTKILKKIYHRLLGYSRSKMAREYAV